MLSKLAELLEYLEQNLDGRHIRQAEQRYKDAIAFQAKRPPLKIGYPTPKFEWFPYPETHADMEKMLYNELCSCIGSADIKDDRLPTIRANYGVGTLPSLFGRKSRILANNLPWVDHCETIDEVKQIVASGIPDLDTGFGKKVSETHAFYRETLAKYPNCEACIHIMHPDLQGPFDVAHLIWGPDIYYALYDEEELVHELMELVTQTYIKTCERFKSQINDTTADGYCYHWSALYPGALLLRNDSAVNLSSEMYQEFVRPYDEQILAHFGSGSMHFCGRADQWLFDMAETKKLKGFNFGYMAGKFGEEFLEKFHPMFAEKQLPVISYILSKDEFSSFDYEKYGAGITLEVGLSSREEAKAVLQRHYMQS